MKTNKILSILAVGIIFSMVSFVSSWAAPPDHNDTKTVLKEAKKGGYQLIDVDVLWNKFRNERESLILVDTRQDWEHHAGHIKGSINFPIEPTWLSRLTQRGALEQFLGQDKTKTFVFY